MCSLSVDNSKLFPAQLWSGCFAKLLVANQLCFKDMSAFWLSFLLQKIKTRSWNILSLRVFVGHQRGAGNQPVNQSTNQSVISLSVNLLTIQPVCQSINQPVNLSIKLPGNQPIRDSTHQLATIQTDRIEQGWCSTDFRSVYCGDISVCGTSMFICCQKF